MNILNSAHGPPALAVVSVSSLPRKGAVRLASAPLCWEEVGALIKVGGQWRMGHWGLRGHQWVSHC